MKNLFLISVITFCLNISNTNSQELLAFNSSPIVSKFKKIGLEEETKTIISLLGDNTFTYKYQGNKVTVVFDGENHTEYFNNKVHYIKSKVVWTSAESCTMILLESNLPRFPFKKGTELDFKVIKVKKGVVYYESTLAGRTWEGKMKKN